MNQFVFAMACYLAASAPTKENLYYQSMQQLQQKQYKQATISLQTLHQMLQKEQASTPANTKKWHLLTLGQSDALVHLAGIAWQQGQHQASCLFHQRIDRKRKTLPSGWDQWNINAALRQRLAASRQSLTTQCTKVPSYVEVVVQPKSANVFVRQTPTGPWKQVNPKRFAVTQTTIALKVEAPAHIDHIKQSVTIPRWKSISLEVTLKPAPPIRIIVVVPQRPSIRATLPPRPPPPPPARPIYQKWWFWTLIGVGVAGGVTAAVAGAMLTADIEHSLQGKDPGSRFKLWGSP